MAINIKVYTYALLCIRKYCRVVAPGPIAIDKAQAPTEQNILYNTYILSVPTFRSSVI